MASSKFVRPPPKVATTYESLPFLEVKVKGDGNCLFRALSDQLNYDEGRHLKVREEICDYGALLLVSLSSGNSVDAGS